MTEISKEYEDTKSSHIYFGDTANTASSQCLSTYTQTIPISIPYKTLGSIINYPKRSLTSEANYVDTLSVENLIIEDAFDLNLEILRSYIAKSFSKLDVVDAVYIYPFPDSIEVETYIKSRDREERNKVFKNQLQLHDKFPDISFNFRVFFTSVDCTFEDVPRGAIICYRKANA